MVHNERGQHSEKPAHLNKEQPTLATPGEPEPTCSHEDLLLLLLSCFSRVQLCATPWTVARQASLSMGFSRQEYWSGLPCPPPGDLPTPGMEPVSRMSTALAGGFFTTSATRKAHVVHESESEVAQSCPTLCDPMDCSLPGSSVHPWDFPGKSTGMGCHCLLQGSSRPRDQIRVSRIVGRFFYRLSHRGSPYGT